ncbi:MAG: M48 family metallopeptidase [Chloroflexota bacterium]
MGQVHADQPLLAIDPARQVRAREYALLRLRLRGVSLILTVVVLALLGPAGWAVDLRDWTAEQTIWQLQIAEYFAILGFAAAVTQMPLLYYRGFVLAHRFGLSNQTLQAWALDLAKGAGLSAVLGAVSIEVLYGFLRLSPDTWWIWTALIFALFSVVLSALGPIVILPMFFHLKTLSDPELAAAVLRLANRAGTMVAGVREIDLSSKSSAANAAVVGLGRSRRIVLGDTLLSQFPRDEVEVVVAHELGHHVHGDLLKGLGIDAVLTICGFLVTNLLLHLAVSHWAFAGVWDLGALPILAVLLGLTGSLSGLITRAYSRHIEVSADAFSLDLTGLGRAFVNSEVRLTNQNLGVLHPPRWVELLFYTHPAPWRRIAMGTRYLSGSQAAAE